MSATVIVSPDLRRLGRTIEEHFEGVQDVISEEVIPADWRGKVVEVRAVDKRRYLNSIDVSREIQTSGDERTRLIEAPAAAGYSDVIERGRRDGSVRGRHPAEKALDKSDGQISTLIDEAGRAIERGE